MTTSMQTRTNLSRLLTKRNLQSRQNGWKKNVSVNCERQRRMDVTKKSDLSDFYFNLGKNVAFGANDVELMKPEKPADSRKAERQTDLLELEKLEEKSSAGTSDKVGPLENLNSGLEIAVVEEKHQGETSTLPERQILSSDVTPVQGTTSQEQQSAEDRKSDHHKRNGDAVAAAKERFLTRKRAKQQ